MTGRSHQFSNLIPKNDGNSLPSAVDYFTITSFRRTIQAVDFSYFLPVTVNSIYLLLCLALVLGSY